MVSNQAIKFAHFVRRTSFHSAAYGRRYVAVARKTPTIWNRPKADVQDLIVSGDYRPNSNAEKSHLK